MSPQLHYQLYGYMYFDFRETLRFGGYRPSVFMQSGLAVAMFMASAALIAYWRWRTKVMERIAGIPTVWLCLLLVLTTVLCKSTGATILLAAGIGVLEGTRWLRGPALLLVLALAPVAYCAARINGWHPERIVELSGDAISPERAASLQFRIDNEDVLIAHALQQRWLGWGRFGRALIRDQEGRIQSVVDGRWIITFGVAGLIGLIALGGLLALPAMALLRRYPARYWSAPQLASVASLAVGLLLWAVDEILNSMLSPIYPMAAGGLISFVLMRWAARVEPRVNPSSLDVSDDGRSKSPA